jgi:hypothetical protein
MSLDLIHPPPNISPETALRISQQAPPTLDSSKSSLPWPLSLLSADDTPEKWTQYENLYVSCLRTGDDTSARVLLDKLIERFGEKNERVMAYQGMWAEARADSEEDIKEVLKEYGAELEADPTNTVCIHARRDVEHCADNFLASSKASHSAPTVTRKASRGHSVACRLPSGVTNRCRIMGRAFGPLFYPKCLRSSHLLSGGGAFDCAKCLECKYWSFLPAFAC